MVSVVSAQWNDWFFDELEQFKGDGKQHDDALDAAVSAFWAANRGANIPDIAPETLDLSVSLPSNGAFGFQSIELPSSQGIPLGFN